MIRVLIVEDNELLGASIDEFLNKNSYDSRWIDDDRELLPLLSVEMFDIVVLDLMLRFSSGEELISKVKSRIPKLPIIVITAKDSIESKQICFNLGADDYITKPFNPKELMFRIEAVCKRVYGLNNIEKIGDIIIDLDNKTIKERDLEIVLTNKEWDVLTFLLKRRNRIVTHNDILNYVWADKDVGEESVRTYIKKLRNILPQGSIETIKGRGYRLK